MAKLIINEEKKQAHIEPEIYGHFSEHLGRCIYEGIYVGENSEIPNVNGMRTDCGSVKGTESSGTALAGRLFCGRIPLEGRNRPQRRQKEND